MKQLELPLKVEWKPEVGDFVGLTHLGMENLMEHFISEGHDEEEMELMLSDTFRITEMISDRHDKLPYLISTRPQVYVAMDEIYKVEGG